MTDLIPQDDFAAFQAAVLAIQQPRTDYELATFIVGQHDTEPRRWAQCTLELDIKRRNLRRAQIGERQLIRRITKLREKGTDAANDKADLLECDLEDQRQAVLGAVREAQALYAIWKSFPRTYTREELNASDAEYWRLRMTRQAIFDLNATGRIGVGHQDSFRMMGLPCPGGTTYVQDVQQRFLEAGKLRVLVAVPTLIPRDTIQRDGLRCLDGWMIPETIERRLYVVQGKSIDDAYTDAAQTALNDGADFLLCVEDDHVIPAGSFEKLWSVYQQCGPRSIVGAWYPQRKEPRTGAPIVLAGGADSANRVRDYLLDNGDVCEVFSIPQGFTLIPTTIFRELPQPWFVTTGNLTQDSFFSQIAREAGYKLLVDTSCRIRHVDRETGRVYE